MITILFMISLLYFRCVLEMVCRRRYASSVFSKLTFVITSRNSVRDQMQICDTTCTISNNRNC